MGSVNQSFSYYDLKEELHDAIKHLQKSWALEATLELMKTTEKYDNIMTKLVKLGAEKIKSDNISYPKFINTEVLNNTYRMSLLTSQGRNWEEFRRMPIPFLTLSSGEISLT